MILLGGITVGGLAGWLFARSRGLKGLDQLHHAGVGAVALGALSLLFLIGFTRFN